MKNSKAASSFKHLACAFLAFVTFVVAIPFVGIEADAIDATTYNEAYFDFESGVKDGAVTNISGEGIQATDFVYESQSNMVYAVDPTDENNMVGGLKSGAKNAQLCIKDTNGRLLDSKLSVEARFYITAFTNLDTPLSLIAWNIGSNKPMVRLGKDGELDTGNCASTTSYKKTGKFLELNRWYTIRVDIDEVNHLFELYVDNEYVATQTIADFSTSKNVRFLFKADNAGTWNAYIDDIRISVQNPGVSYDFNDGNIGGALSSEYLSRALGLSGGEIKNMIFTQDPADASNIVIGKGSEKSWGCFFLNADDALLASSTFSVEMKLYVKTFPTKDSSSNSGSPLSLFSWNNGGNIPILRLKEDGTLMLTKSSNSSSNAGSSSNYSDTGKKLAADTWYTIRLDINAAGKYVALYVDGEHIYSNATPTFTASEKIRFLQPNGVWDIYVDDLSIKEYQVNKIDAVIDFENFAENTALTNPLLSASVFPEYSKKGEASLKVVADPENPDNMVSYNTGKGYFVSIYDKDLRLSKTDFVVGADIRFAEFPKMTADGSYAENLILSWVNGSAADPSYYFFCRVDSDGYLLDGNKNPTSFKFDKDTWYNVSAHCNGSTGAYDVYIDGEYVFSGDVGTPSATPAQSYIRILYYSTDTTKTYSAYVDNVMLYESPRIERTKDVAKVIWDIDFDEYNDGDKVTKDQLNAMSSVADINSVSTAFTGSNSVIATINNSKAIKLTDTTHNKQFDLGIGNGDFDPLRNGTVRLSMDLTFESLPSSGTLQLLRWRRTAADGTAKTLNILDFNQNSGNIKFLGKSTGAVIEVNKTYNFELIFNTRIVDGEQYYDVTFNLENLTDKTGKVTVVDSMPMWRDTAMTMEGFSYFLDDAGNKCYLHFFGFAKKHRTDIDGNKVTDSAGNYIFDDKLVACVSPSTDVFRMFQGFGVFYVDNLIVETVDEQPIVDTGFEGWEKFSFTYDMNTQATSRYYLGNGTLKEKDGNTYVELPKAYATSSSNGQKHFFIGDHKKSYVGKNVYLETDIYLDAVSDVEGGFKSSALMAIVTQKKGSASENNPFGWSSDGTGYCFLLHADSNGKLYTSGSADTGEIGQLAVGGWTKIGVKLEGNGEYWDNYSIYINDKIVYIGNFSGDFISRQKIAKTMSVRFTNIKGTIVGYDNVSVSNVANNESLAPLALGFEDEAERLEAVSRLGSGWRYGTVGSNYVKILGTDDSKYLRVEHRDISTSELTRKAYIDVLNKNFIDADTYVIETSVRYTADTAYSLNVAEIYRPEADQSASVVQVRGDTNKMFITLRGVQYDLVNSAGNTIYAAKTTDEEFTDISILVDNANNTYTLYTNGGLAYYIYNEQILPCVNMPLHFISNDLDGVSDFIRLLEIPDNRSAESTLDIDFVNVKTLKNGIATEIKGTQTRSVVSDSMFDVRFVSAVDTLYGAEIGYEVGVEYTDEKGTHNEHIEVSSSCVFDKISAEGGYVTAEELDCSYLAAIAVVNIPNNVDVEFIVRPFVKRGEIKVYGDTYEVAFSNGKIVE